MWKRIVKKVLASEQLLDLVIAVVLAAMDREFTDAEKDDLKEKAIEAVLDIIS